ncbi:hypothetical protein ThrDRAFT_03699 [Frankia casuarinae]|nr:hypothetical protein [Frankia casuarinae]EYT90642.1 hypothetical protein ThrDRAFT_03699 [Frankia casuarinae]
MRRIAAAISAVLLLTLSLVFTEAGVSRAAPPVTPVLMHIRFAHAASARVDIVTFVFRPSAPKDVRAEYVPRSGLIQDGSGNRVFVLGRSFVKVTFHNSAAHNIEGRPQGDPQSLFVQVDGVRRGAGGWGRWWCEDPGPAAVSSL